MANPDPVAAPFLFRRAEVARHLVDALTGALPFNYRSGLFLAAPRRTGKSTFLRNDLIPELTARTIISVYVDLWMNKQADPGQLIADAIKAALRDTESLPRRAARSAGLRKIGLGSFVSFDVDRIGAPDGATLTDALTALRKRTGHPVALIVDEAQHALTTEAGVNAMFSLKAARDALNQGTGDGETSLLLVFTGSHRDKLANLVLRRDQPFFGAEILDFPLLGREFTNAYAEWLNERLAEDNRFDADDVLDAFERLGRRPEMLQSVLREIALGEGKAPSLKRALATGATALRERLWEDYDRDHDAMSALQKAVLTRLMEEGDRFAPFTAASLAAYSAALGEAVETPAVQTAIEALRQKNIIWRSARGAYSLEDRGMIEWFRARQGAGETR